MKIIHKCGIKIPTSTERPFRIDENNRNRLWRYATEKDIHNVNVSFDILKEDFASAPVCWKNITGIRFHEEIKMGTWCTEDNLSYWIYICWCGVKRNCKDGI